MASINDYFRLLTAPNHLDTVVQEENGKLCLNDELMLDEAESHWDAFQDALNQRFTAERVQELAGRYGFNFETEKAAGPLRRRHVQLWMAATTSLVGKCFKERLPEIGGKHNLSNASSAEIHAQAKAYLELRQRIQGPRLSTGCGYHPLRIAQERQWLYVGLENLEPNAWLERMTKSISTLELEHKELIPIRMGDETYYYKVHAKVAHEGCIAYALKPVGNDNQLPYRLIFRPTADELLLEDMTSNWKDNFYWDYGGLGYAAARADLNRVLEDPKFLPAGQKLHVSGYSLGSAHAQLFIQDHPRKVDRFTSYNAPGAMDGAPNNLDQFDLDIDVIFVDGDQLKHVGKYHLGYGVPIESENIRIKISRAIKPPGFGSAKLHILRVYDTDVNRVFVGRDVEIAIDDLDDPRNDTLPHLEPLNFNGNPMEDFHVITDPRDNFLGGDVPVLMKGVDLGRGIIGAVVIPFFSFLFSVCKWIGALFGITIVRKSESYGVYQPPEEIVIN